MVVAGWVTGSGRYGPTDGRNTSSQPRGPTTVCSRVVLSLVRVQMCSPTSGDGSRPQRHPSRGAGRSAPRLAAGFARRHRRLRLGQRPTIRRDRPQRLPAVQAAWPSSRTTGHATALVRGAAHQAALALSTPLQSPYWSAVKSPRLTNAQPEARRTDRLASKRRQHVAKRNELPSMDVHRRTAASGHPYTE